MKGRILSIFCIGASLGLAACGGDTGQDCGEGTVAQGDQCVPEGAVIECGAGTTLQDGACVADVDIVECGDGTTLTDGVCVPDGGGLNCGPGTSEVAGECVPDSTLACADGTTEVDGECVADAACGPDTELVDGECVSLIGCGEGTVLVDGECALIDPFDGIESEAPEPNDPAFFEDANIGMVTLGAEGETVLVTGNIDAPTQIGEEEEAFLAADFDVVVFEGTAGTRINLEATAIGASGVAVALVYIADEGDDKGFIRIAFPFGSRNAWRQAVLPYDGNYMIRVGTPTDTATFFNFITQGALNFGGLAGEPEGADDFTWILGLTHMAPAAPETFVGNATFMFDGDDVRESPQALVEADAGTIVQLGLEVGPGTLGAFLTHNSDYGDVLQLPGLVVVPDGGLHITVDSFAERTNDPSFSLTAVQQVQVPQGELPSGDTTVDGTLVGNSTQFISFSVAAPSVVSFAGGPAEDADANLGMYLTTGDLTETFAGSFDDLFGLPSNEESFAAFLQPGDYQLIILHESLDEDNGDHEFTITINVQGVTTLGSLAAEGELTASDDTLAEGGAATYFAVTTESLGLFAANAAPEENLDVALRVFSGNFLAAREFVLADVDANFGFEGEEEDAELPLGAGVVLVGLWNSGLTAEADFGVDLTVGLTGIETEVEPNDTSADANVITLDGDVLVAGRLDADVDTTADWFRFSVEGISEVFLAAGPVGNDGAQGIRLSVFAAADPNTPIAIAETFLDFFSGQEINPELALVLDAGSYFAVVEQIDGDATGDYLLSLSLGEVLDCRPGAAVCDGDDLEICIDGFDLEVVTCDTSCNEVGGAYGCGLVSETEPNDEEAQNLGAELHAEVSGNFLDGDDVDLYSFTLEGAARVTARTAFSVAPGADTVITLIDADENTIDSNDDFDGLFSQVEAILDAGTYTVIVESFGQGTGNYRLVVDIEPARCEGDEAACGDGGVVACNGFDYEVIEECGFGCEVGDDGPFCTEPEFTFESEPNNGFGDNGLTYNSVDLPYTGFGTIDTFDDQDFYFVELADGFGAYEVTFETLEGGDNNPDTYIFICSLEDYFTDGVCDFSNRLAYNDDGNPDFYSRIETELDPGAYFFIVDAFGTGEYVVNIEAQVPGLTVFDETEPNNDSDDAELAGYPALITGAISPGDDEDWFQLEIDSPGTVLSFTTSRVDGGVDTQMWLCSDADPGNCAYEAGNLDSDDDSAGSLQSTITWEFDEVATYYIAVRSFGTGQGGYLLTVLDVTD